MIFKNSNSAFEYYYNFIHLKGIDYGNTKSIFNIGFTILNPMDNIINSSFRKWSKNYADIEWNWYLSCDRSVIGIKKYGKIWDKMHNGDNIVNSNYGYQWNRNKQLDFVIDELLNNQYSRRAVVTIYDGKDHSIHSYDTPCTLTITFNIINNKLNMCVVMRSNDLWYGFCNDQYCFSKLMELVSKRIGIEIGYYYHFVQNFHLYNKFLNKHEK